MPFRPLRSLADAEASVWLARDDVRLLERIRLVWATAERLAPRRFEPGLRGYRSLEEKQAAELVALRRHAQDLRARVR